MKLFDLFRKEKEDLLPTIETMTRNFFNRNVEGWQDAQIMRISYTKGGKDSILVTIEAFRQGKVIGRKGAIIKELGRFLSRGLGTFVKVTVTKPQPWE